MKPADRLTLIVQVKDQIHLLERWLVWAQENQTALPIIVADGSYGPEARALLEGSRFRNLRLSYFSRGTDNNRNEFYQKTVAALEKCQTPYCALLADDDLLDFGALLDMCRALEDPQNVCVRGWVHNFSLTEGTPEAFHPSVQSLPQDPSLDDPRPSDRVRRHFLLYNLNFHDIFRVQDLIGFKRKLLQNRIEDPFLGELFTSVLAVIQGKVVRRDIPFLYRASRRASNDQRYFREHDNWDRMFLGHWMKEYQQCIDLWHAASDGELDKNWLHCLFRSYYAPSIVDCLRKDLVRERLQRGSCHGALRRPSRAPIWVKVLLETLRPFEKVAQKLREQKKRTSAVSEIEKEKTRVDCSHVKIVEFLSRYHSGMGQAELQRFL
jgi:glycosyltransferase domain-containing protein